MKPWPSDAVMIVASLAGQELRENMEGVLPGVCRDCCRLITEMHDHAGVTGAFVY